MSADGELDLKRLAELQQLLGDREPDIVTTLVAQLGGAMDAIAAALRAGDLDAVAQAAHAARNSALMIDAQPMLSRLAELEAGARRRDAPGALAAHRALAEDWPRLRHRLQTELSRRR